MNRALIKKCIYESRWLWLACATATFAFCWVRIWLVSRLETARFKEILDLLPGDWQRFSPVDLEWLITYHGRIALTFDEPIIALCITTWAISRGSAAVSGELGAGTMEMLLAQPISRTQAIVSHAFVTVVGTAALAVVAWLGIYVGIVATTVKQEVRPSWSLPFPLPVVGREIPIPFAKAEERFTPMTEFIAEEKEWREENAASAFIPGAMNLFAMGLMLAGLTTFLSSLDRYRWRTIGFIIGFYVVEVAFKVIGLASDGTAWMRWLSVFTAYEPEALVKMAVTSPDNAWAWNIYEDGRWSEWGPLAYHVTLGLPGVIGYVLAVQIFRRRDLPAPL